MDLRGQKVEHKLFGPGTITTHSGHYFMVCFDCGEKEFAYPDSFKHFLTLEDTAIAEVVKEDLAALDKKDDPAQYLRSKVLLDSAPSPNAKPAAAKKTSKNPAR